MEPTQKPLPNLLNAAVLSGMMSVGATLLLVNLLVALKRSEEED